MTLKSNENRHKTTKKKKTTKNKKTAEVSSLLSQTSYFWPTKGFISDPHINFKKILEWVYIKYSVEKYGEMFYDSHSTNTKSYFLWKIWFSEKKKKKKKYVVYLL